MHIAYLSQIKRAFAAAAVATVALGLWAPPAAKALTNLSTAPRHDGATNSGAVTTTNGDMRIMQFAIKHNF